MPKLGEPLHPWSSCRRTYSFTAIRAPATPVILNSLTKLSDKQFREDGRRPRVFCASLADVFDNKVLPEWRHDLFALIRRCRRLDWLLLMKRPQNIAKMLPPDWYSHGYPNVWLGITAEDQKHFDQRWAQLSMMRAVVKFVSYEPALGPLRFPNVRPLPDWVISGGENGAGARPLKLQWVQDIFADCGRYGIARLHKQWGHYGNNPLVAQDGLTIKEARQRDPHGKGGGLVGGKLIREFPVPRPVGSW
jgi:protein gp37